MKRFLVALGVLFLAVGTARGQSLDDLNIQIHGYATQGFAYTTNNNILTMKSSDGSPQWTDAVVNVTAQPTPKLRVGVQARYMILGNLGNAITLDWAAVDYKVNDAFGVRFGKVKTPSGLFNETQDIDPSYMWSLLPQGVYPLMSRNSLLSHYGGVVYGTVKLGQKLGKLEYRGWAGGRNLPGDDGYFLNQTESGETLPNGISWVLTGEALHWKTPVSGLMIGASNTQYRSASAPLLYGPYSGAENLSVFNSPSYFAKYEKNKVMVAGEYIRLLVPYAVALTGLPVNPGVLDERSWYGMASYKVTDKLMIGLYDSQSVDHKASLGAARDSMDWAISGRYDFNQYLYAKAEEHILHGTLVGYDITLNPAGLQPNTDMTIFKVGVSF